MKRPTTNKGGFDEEGNRIYFRVRVELMFTEFFWRMPKILNTPHSVNCIKKLLPPECILGGVAGYGGNPRYIDCIWVWASRRSDLQRLQRSGPLNTHCKYPVVQRPITIRIDARKAK